MEPVDPLDQLLRGRPPHPWAERARTALTDRWPWLVAGGVIAAVVAVVLLVRAPASPPEVTLPMAGSTPTGVTTATTSSDPRPDAVAPGSSTPAALVVHVAGAVNAPGLVTLPAGSRVAAAVEQAGGLRADADSDRVNLAAPLADGVRVFIPAVGQPDPPPAVVVSGGPPTDGADGLPTPASPVDLNSATATQLEALPGVGPSTAAAIVAYRSEHRRFGSVEELQEVRGIGPSKFEAIESLVTVGP